MWRGKRVSGFFDSFLSRGSFFFFLKKKSSYKDPLAPLEKSSSHFSPQLFYQNPLLSRKHAQPMVSTINIYRHALRRVRYVCSVNTGVEIDDNIDSRNEDFGRNEDDY